MFEKLQHERNQGLKCLKDNLSAGDLLPWIIQLYSSFYEESRESGISKISKIAVEMIISYTLITIDYYSGMYDLYFYLLI